MLSGSSWGAAKVAKLPCCFSTYIRLMTFEELDLAPSLLEAIGYMGFKDATPVQEQAIPIIRSGKDLIACAQTGTGKTGAFLLPLLDHMIRNVDAKERIQALIMVPTRELALQIDQQVEAIGYGTGIHSIAIYGGDDGDSWDQQKKALTEGADIIIATPGKLISHLNMGYVDFSGVDYLILDEADRMLDIGFHDDIVKIISFLPEKRQSLMFSATMPPKIRSFAKEILNNPDEITLAVSKPAEGVLQAAYLCFNEQKPDLVLNLLEDKKEYDSIIIFSSTKKGVSEIVRTLNKKGIKAEGISSDLEQDQREDVVRRFSNKKVRILVATDVISRGIDIKDIQLVLNYNVPRDPEDYVHRVGRTARAKTTGVALTLINPEEMRDFDKIEKLIEKEIIKLPPPDGLGPGPEYKVSHQPRGGGRFKGRGKKRR